MRGTSKQLVKKVGIVMALFMLLTCLGMLLGNLKPVNASAKEDIYAKVSAQYTAIDKLKNGDSHTKETIEKYCKEINDTMDIGDEVTKLNQMIPQEVLDGVSIGGRYQYFGAEYGFVVERQYMARYIYPDGYIVPEDKVDEQTYLHIAVIDYTWGNYTFENEVRNNEYIAKISIILDADFHYELKSGRRVPVKWQDDMSVSYSLWNIGILQTLLNENALNYGDPGYDKLKDDGPIIQQCRVNFKEIKHYTEAGDWGTAVQIPAEAALAIGAELVDKIAQLSVVYNILKTGYGTICDINDVIHSFDVKQRVTELNHEAYIFTEMSKTDQRKDDTLASYTRAVSMQPHKDYVLRDGAYYENIITLDDTNAASRLSQMIQFDLAAIDPSGNVEFVNTGESGARVPTVVYSESKLFGETYPMELNEEADLYLLPCGEQCFEFTASLTGTHYFKEQAEEGYRISVCNAVSKEEVAVNADGSRDMLAGERYLITVSSAEPAERVCSTLTLLYLPPKAELGSNTIARNGDVYYVRFKSDLFRWYDFTCSDETASITPIDKYLQPCGERAVGSYTQYISVDDEIYLCIESDLPQFELAIKNYKKVIFVNADLDEIILEEGETLDGLPEYSVPGGIFQGWKTQAGEAITAAQVVAADEPNVTLYPDITWIEYNIVYIENGGTEIPDGVYTARDVVPLNNHIMREGYLFLGWCENADLSDEPFKYISAGNVEDKVFYACWAKEIITATLDVNAFDTDGVSASVASSAVEIAYNSLVDLPVPEIEGFDFDGWFCGDKQYTLSDGVMITSFVEKDDLTLTAHWTRQSYKIKINFGEDGAPSFKWLAGENTLADEETEIEYVSGLCPNCWMLEKMPLSAYYKAGHIYQKLVTADGRIACWDTFRPNLQDGAEFELTAVYGKESYTIVFYEFAETDIPSITAEYGEALIMPEGRGEEGRDFDCWIVADYDKNNAFKAPFAKGAVFQYGYMPDLTVNEQGDAIIYLARKFNPKTYTITFVDGDYRWEMQVRYGEPVSAAPIPSREGHGFAAWYSDEGELFNSLGTFVGEGGIWLIAHDVQAEPYYHPNTYTITYYDPGYSNQITRAYAVYGQQITLKTIERTHYNGYWSINGKQYAMGSTFKYDIASSMTFSAVWQGKYYDIVYHNSYDSRFGSCRTESTTYEYGKGLELKQKAYFYKPHGVLYSEYEFLGYYADAAFKKPKTSISKTQSGTVHVYIKWRRIVDNRHRGGTKEVIKLDFDDNYETIGIHLGTQEQINQFKEFGFTQIIIQVQFAMWEKDDGYQQVYLYDGKTSSAKRVAEWNFEHGPGTTLTEKRVYYHEFKFNIDQLSNIFTLYLRFGASGWWGNTWYNDDFHVGVQFLCDETEKKSMENGSLFYDQLII